MTHTITKSEHRITTPTGLYEANYRRLIRLVPELGNLPVDEYHYLSRSHISINILQQYKYTTVISLKQSLQASLIPDMTQKLTPASLLNSIDMELRVCHDACLLEVIGYQGKAPIHSVHVYPNKHMLQVDEKRQLNLFLKDVLENSLKNEYHHKPRTGC